MQHGCNTRRGKKLYLYYSDPSGYTKRLRFIMRLSTPLSLCLLPYLIFISSICLCCSHLPSLFGSASVRLSLSHPVSTSLSHSHHLSIHFCPHPSFFLCLCPCLSLSLPLSTSASLHIRSRPVYISNCLSLPIRACRGAGPLPACEVRLRPQP